jgi:transmembrane sensor
MPSDTPRDPSKALIEEAIAWHVRLCNDRVTDGDKAAFYTWLTRHPSHSQAYAEIEQLWGALDAPVQSILHPAEAVERQPPPHAAAASAHLSRRAMLCWSALAAGMAVGIVAGNSWHQRVFDDWRSDYVTGVGEQATVALEDGSKVTLNTDTAIAVTTSLERRTVRLFRGEAFFTIAPAPLRPFLVRAAGRAIRAVGTAFNVRTMGQRTTVSVVAESVEVMPAGHTVTSPSVHVSAGHEMAYYGEEIEQVRPCDVTAVTAWKHGRIVFYRTPLGQVIADVNRYHPGRILLLNPRLSDLPVSGVFHTTSPDAVLTTIERTLRVHTARLTNRLILLY